MESMEYIITNKNGDYVENEGEYTANTDKALKFKKKLDALRFVRNNPHAQTDGEKVIKTI